MSENLLRYGRDADPMRVSPGRFIELFAQHIASLISRVGAADAHNISGSLSGRKRRLGDKVEALRNLSRDVCAEFSVMVEDQVKELLKD